MESDSTSAFAVGVASTRGALREWIARPGTVLWRWLGGSLLATALLLVGTLVVAEVASPDRGIDLSVPPVTAGGTHYVWVIVGHNLLVLGLHSFACVAGFIAGASVPMQAAAFAGWRRRVHDWGARVAILFVIAATVFSLANQVLDLGTSAASVATQLHVSPALLLVGLLPHAAVELVAIFLPLAAWVSASRRGTWNELLAAAAVTTALAVPLIVAAATWETYGAPHLISLVAPH